jgi:hypothetical protein
MQSIVNTIAVMFLVAATPALAYRPYDVSAEADIKLLDSHVQLFQLEYGR